MDSSRAGDIGFRWVYFLIDVYALISVLLFADTCYEKEMHSHAQIVLECTYLLHCRYHLKTHWKIILAGTRGAGMFNHSDSLLTSSWHAHLMGEKWW